MAENASPSSASSGSPRRRAAISHAAALERGARGFARSARRDVAHLDDDRYFHSDIAAATRYARRRDHRGGRRKSPAGSGRRAMSGKRPDWLEIRRGKAPLIVSIPHGGVELRDYEAGFVSPWIARKDPRMGFGPFMLPFTAWHRFDAGLARFHESTERRSQRIIELDQTGTDFDELLFRWIYEHLGGHWFSLPGTRNNCDALAEPSMPLSRSPAEILLWASQTMWFSDRATRSPI